MTASMTPLGEHGVLYQPGDLMPVEVIGVDLGQQPGDSETREL